MLKNLYKTWEILAPEEVTFWDNGEAITLLKNQPPCHTWVTVNPSLDEQDALFGYILRCIHSRKVYCSFQQVDDYCKADVQIIPGTSCQVGKYSEACYEVLLLSYLKALAAQRPITEGNWQHFKGGDVEVVGVAKWVGFSHLPNPGCYYVLEESPEILIAHGVKGEYYAGKDYGDRVFYSHDGKGYAREKTDFLGLIGPGPPESEGVLRFVRGNG